MDFNSIWDNLKKTLGNFDMASILSSVKGLFMGLFTGPLGWIASALGLKDKASEAWDKKQNELLASKMPDLVTARTTMPAKVADNPIYDTIATKYGLPADSPVIAKLKSIMSKATEDFLANGIPPLENGSPVEAVRASLKVRDAIISGLVGAKNIDQEAAVAIAASLTKLTPEANEFTAANIPNGGLVNLLATVQVALNEKKTLSAADIKFEPDPSALSAGNQTVAQNQAKAVVHPEVSAGVHTTTPSPAPGGKKPTVAHI